PGNWEVTATGPSILRSKTDSIGGTTGDVDPGDYDLAEVGPDGGVYLPGYAPRPFVCLGKTVVGNRVSIADGEEVFCYVRNVQNPPATVPKHNGLLFLASFSYENLVEYLDSIWSPTEGPPGSIGLVAGRWSKERAVRLATGAVMLRYIPAGYPRLCVGVAYKTEGL